MNNERQKKFYEKVFKEFVGSVNQAKLNDDIQKALEQLIEASKKLEDIVAEIRFQTWPTMGLGIGLKAEVLDEALNLSDKAIPKAKKLLKKYEKISGQKSRK